MTTPKYHKQYRSWMGRAKALEAYLKKKGYRITYTDAGAIIEKRWSWPKLWRPWGKQAAPPTVEPITQEAPCDAKQP